MSAFAAPEVWPFTLAAVLMLALAVAEALALLLGFSASHWLDGAADADHAEGLLSAVLGWLHVGRVPLLVLLVTFLTVFAVAGFAVQFGIHAVAGFYLPAVLVAVAAFLFAIVAVRLFGRSLAQIIPRDESSAVADASLVGCVATVVIGTASRGKAAEARTRDSFGNAHYVMVEPEEDGEQLQAGASVLLVRHLRGRHFSAIANPKPEFL